MWPFKTTKNVGDVDFESRISSFSEQVAKDYFLLFCEDLGEKVALSKNEAGVFLNKNLSSSINDFFTAYIDFNPLFMDIEISIDNIGESKLAKGFYRIGYNSGWSEIIVDNNGSIFTAYPEDSDGMEYEKSEEAQTIWHYMSEQLSVTYPEIAVRNITRLSC